MVTFGAVDRTPGRWSRSRPPAWPFVLAATLALVGATPLAWVGRYYFRGDTQIAYLGWWYHLGEEVRSGRIPLMEPLTWEAAWAEMNSCG